MPARQWSGPSLCKTSPAAVLYPTMTSAPGAGISATGLVNSACADCLWLTASGPHSAMLMAMHSPAHNCF
ncbi:hypothetical protein AB1287_12170 [Enterobacter asburiae]|uniref:hypothetical protein n=1 Tax=Scandinavium sp. UTDF21-P1B TaxID=3446379 RepID=UPI003475EA61